MAIDWSQIPLDNTSAAPASAINWDAVDKVAGDVKAAPAQQVQDQKSILPRSLWDQLSDFGSAGVHNVLKPIHGLTQAVQHGLAGAADYIAPNSAISQKIRGDTTSDDAALAKWEADYQKSTPDSAGAMAGATAGTIAPFLLSGPAKGLQAAGDYVGSLVPNAIAKAAPLVPRVVSGAAQGGLLSLAAPITEGGDYASQKTEQAKTSALIGGGIPVVGAIGGALYNAAKPLINPNSVVADALRKWLPNGVGAVDELVPGSRPTTAQVAPNPNIVAAEKALSENPAYKPLFDARTVSNNDARWSAVDQIAKTPTDVDAAIAARKAITSPMQDALLENGKPVPADGIIAKVKELANSPLGTRPAIGSAAKDMLATLQENVILDPVTGKATIPPAHLDAIRQNVKDYLAKHTPDGKVGSQQQAAFEPVRGAIVDAIEGANPGYRDYLAQYARHSVPINTMEAGQSIVDNLGMRAAGAGGAAQITLPGISGALKKATSGPYGIAPDAQAALESIQADIQRASISNSVKSSGSDTSYNLKAPGWIGKQLYGENFNGPASPVKWLGGAVGSYFGNLPGAAGGYLGASKLADFASSRVNKVLAEALLNPAKAQELLQPPITNKYLQQLLERSPQAGLLLGNQLNNGIPAGASKYVDLLRSYKQ